MKRIIAICLFILVWLTSCNFPATSPSTTSPTIIENKATQAWVDCVNGTGVLTHVCLFNKLSSFSEATPIETGYTVPADTLVLVSDPVKGTNPFIVNGNQSAVEGTDYERVAGAQTGLVTVFYTKTNVVMAIAGKQIKLNQPASLYTLFPGWPNWPPVLPTPLVIQTPEVAAPSATPLIIPVAFSSADFMNIWYSQTKDTRLVNLLDEAFSKWGKYYGSEFTAVTYSLVPAGSIIWPVTIDNVVDTSKQPFKLYEQDCVATINADQTVIYTTCDLLVINPPFKYLRLQDWQSFPHGMLPALPEGIIP